jgi:uncharacterized protein (TIGR04255 family)
MKLRFIKANYQRVQSETNKIEIEQREREMNNKTIVINGKEIDLASFVDDSPAYKVKEKLLENVVFEVAHEPNFKAFVQKHEFIEEFRHVMPIISYYRGPDMLEDNVHFYSPDSGIGFNPGLTKTFVECRSYKNFDKYRENVEIIFNLFQKAYWLPQITRASLRYVNKIRLASDDVPKIFDYFTLEMHFDKKQIGFLSTEFLHTAPGGALVRSRFGPAFNGREIELIWDNDVFIQQPISYDQAIALLPYLHSISTKLFLEFLSEKGKEKYIIFED